jgi:hypothetical protein
MATSRLWPLSVGTTGILATQIYVWELSELSVSGFASLLMFIGIFKFWVKE